MVMRPLDAPEKPTKIIAAEFYRTDAGNEPAKAFLLKTLTKEERTRVGVDIRTVEYGWPKGMPVCRDLKNGLYEVRTQLSTRICRVLFALYGTRMVLLHGFVKKTQETPKHEMDVALDRKKALEARK